MRLDKLVAQSAGLSRTQARDLIRAGRVLVENKAVLSADFQVDEQAEINLNGRTLTTKTERHIMLNKPAGLLTAARDLRAATIMDLLPPQFEKIKCMPVGRLDKDTSGLLLLTTDGELAHRLLSPKRKIAKTYQALVEGRLGQRDADAFQNGIVLADFTAKPARLTILQADEKRSLALAVLHEGKNRQVRRMFGSLGHEVLELKRLRFGPIALDEHLAIGEYRDLTQEELDALKEAVNFV